MLDLSKSERDSSGPEFQSALHFVDFPGGNRMEPVVATLSTEDHELSGHHVDVFGHSIRVFEMHTSAASQGKRDENLFKWRMSVNVWGNSLAWRVVIDSQLIEHSVSFKETLLRLLKVLFQEIFFKRKNWLGFTVFLPLLESA